MKPPRSGGFIFIHNKKLERLSSGKREKGLKKEYFLLYISHIS